jgi:hypothetical protein
MAPKTVLQRPAAAKSHSGKGHSSNGSGKGNSSTGHSGSLFQRPAAAKSHSGKGHTGTGMSTSTSHRLIAALKVKEARRSKRRMETGCDLDSEEELSSAAPSGSTSPDASGDSGAGTSTSHIGTVPLSAAAAGEAEMLGYGKGVPDIIGKGKGMGKIYMVAGDSFTDTDNKHITVTIIDGDNGMRGTMQIVTSPSNTVGGLKSTMMLWWGAAQGQGGWAFCLGDRILTDDERSLESEGVVHGSVLVSHDCEE